MSARKSDAEKYLKKVDSGKIPACRNLKRLASMMLPRFDGGYKRWHFDIERAEKPVRFIERFCKVPSGRMGAPFVLTDYERNMIELAFGFVDDDGNRQFQEVLMVQGRKNGKTSVSAALELYMLLADGEGSPQIYNVATSKDQASLAYGAVLKMVRQSKTISRHLRKGVIPDRDADGLMCDGNMGYLTPLSSQTRNLDGLDVHFAVIDELAAIVNRDLYDLVKQGMAARDQPMLLCITTNGFVRGGIFDAQKDYADRLLEGKVKDDRFLPIIYELDSRDEWDKGVQVWKKANPGLGTVKKIDYLKSAVAKAKQDPEYLPTVLTKDFNIPENQAAAWLTFEEAVNEELFDFASMGFNYCIVGFDASDTTDLTAAKALMMRPGDDRIYERSMYWIPETVIRERSDAGKRSSRDAVPYEAWIARGLMRMVPGNKIDKHVLVEWIMELKEEGLYTYAVGFDPWHMDDSTLREVEQAVGKGRVEKVRQGAATLSMPMKQMRADMRAHRFVDNHNPVNEWCRMNVSVKVDVNDNIQPVKKLNNPINRIDGWAAEIDAYVTLMNRYDDYQAML